MALLESVNRIFDFVQQERRDEQSQLMQLARMNIEQNQARVNKLYDAFTRSQAREYDLTDMYLKTIDMAAGFGIVDEKLNDLPMRTKDSQQIVGMNRMKLAEQAKTYQNMIAKNRQDQQDLSDAIISLTQQTAPIREYLLSEELKRKTDTGKDTIDLQLKLMDRAQRLGADYQTVENNLLNIVSLTNKLEETPDNMENRIAAHQAIITSFNKITDPTSVVRESEYERTPAGAAWLNRLRAGYEKITAGGVLTEKDIIEIRDSAVGLADLRRKIINEKLEGQIRIPARRYGINPDEVAPLFQDPMSRINKINKPKIQQVAPKLPTTGNAPIGKKTDWINEFNEANRGIK